MTNISRNHNHAVPGAPQQIQPPLEKEAPPPEQNLALLPLQGLLEKEDKEFKVILNNIGEDFAIRRGVQPQFDVFGQHQMRRPIMLFRQVPPLLEEEKPEKEEKNINAEKNDADNHPQNLVFLH